MFDKAIQMNLRIVRIILTLLLTDFHRPFHNFSRSNRISNRTTDFFFLTNCQNSQNCHATSLCYIQLKMITHDLTFTTSVVAAKKYMYIKKGICIEI